MADSPIPASQKEVNKNIYERLGKMERKVEKIEVKMQAKNEEHIKQMFEMKEMTKDMIVSVFDTKLEPFLLQLEKTNTRLDIVENELRLLKDAPKDKALAQKNWVINTLLGIVITMLTMLLNAIYGFLPF